jgi:hypothetical protein
LSLRYFLNDFESAAMKKLANFCQFYRKAGNAATTYALQAAGANI